MYDEKTCPICSKQLYSIITRRIGEYAVCVECDSTLAPLIRQVLDDLIQKCIVAGDNHIPMSALIPTLVNDYQLDDIRKVEILKLNEVSRR